VMFASMYRSYHGILSSETLAFFGLVRDPGLPCWDLSFPSARRFSPSCSTAGKQGFTSGRQETSPYRNLSANPSLGSVCASRV